MFGNLFNPAAMAGMPGMQQPPPQEEKEEDGGVPLPPGFTNKVTDFESKAGKAKIKKINQKLGNSIAFTPLVTSVSPCIMLFIINSVFMSFNNLWTVISNGFSSLSTAISSNHRLSIQNRLTAIVIGLGLILFALWRGSKLGFVGGKNEPVIEHTPFLMEQR
ncbi:hypothetical protein GPJ56_007933 [Histomonas meleagridis]|uniref:uncharacterized protein n=1 Tax=Histomonas meleagridis TaxID=135588 RepID=UPI00355AA295|nr:hypothetical protein GPJ56_007933 [Histomonas meleagridis]KAH0803875.1 hypothetical protein GO595_002705 [Histomonas meleagridis]